MHRLLPPVASDPGEGLDEDGFFAAYAYPEDRTWLRANMVASVDGAATADGRSAGLSSPADKRVFRVLRGLADVVLVGAGTVRAEGYAAVLPKETYPQRRRAAGQPSTAAIAVVSRSLDLDLGSALFGGPARTIVVTTGSAEGAQLARVRDVAEVVVAGDDALDVPAVVSALAERGLPRILCEGGPALLRDVSASGCLDELCLTISPQLRGGDGQQILRGGLGAPVGLQLTQVLEEAGNLFLRYSR